MATLGLDLARRWSRRCCWVADHRHDEVARVGGGLDELAAALHDVDGSRSAALPFFFLERYVPSYLREWAAFVEAVRTGTPPPVTTADARAPLVIGLAAWRSLRERRPVAIAEVGA